jgi:hypothetical protein
VIFKKLFHKYIKNKIHQIKYRLYEIKIIKQNNDVEIIQDEYYTRKSKGLLLYNYIDSNRQLFRLNDVKYIPMNNIKEIQINIKDEIILNYIVFDELAYDMTLDEINKENVVMQKYL